MTSSWKEKRVVVTGGAGFLGSFVVERLKALGCSQIVVPRAKEYDLVRMEAVQRLYEDANPDLVIHLAARVGGIGANQANPGRFFYDNLMMGAQLIEAGRQHGLKKFVALGTICAYPKFASIPFREDDIWDGYPEETNAPYGLAKKMMLAQSQAYRQQYGFNSIVLFPVNLYGPRDNFDLATSHVIPALIRKFDHARENRAEAVTLWGDGSPSREFLYVEDAAEGILCAAEVYDDSLPVNLGTGTEITIKDLAVRIAHEIGFAGKIVWDTSKPNGQPRRCLDVTRAKELFGFQARHSLEIGLKKTIEWFMANRHKLREVHF
ncbi:GDP-L-fucose synthase [Nitrospira sp. KM1]|uniref:GDP-L-fucose synthase family protein n=1 Tax=Nitrospira sp. KM1 TaxID=1936990 RepID=UPI0013A78EE7|nr:GDP-L-fucose synthase [Nitrospira sp. KM1]BCA53564.1 GDP-L-fucose synthase [Nitrospira sp. KM1]